MHGTQGLCRSHYNQEREAMTGTCSVEGCGRPTRSRGLCVHHYSKERATKSPRCSEEGCGFPSRARGLCGTHYNKARREERAERLADEYAARTAGPLR